MDPTDAIPLKRQKCENHHEVDIMKCIICQKDTGVATTTGEKGRNSVESSAKAKGGNDIVAQRLKQIDTDNVIFVYHNNNICFKGYIRNNDRKVTKGTPESKTDVRKTRAQQTPRDPVQDKSDSHYEKICVVCGHKSVKRDYQKYRISEEGRAESFLKATLHFMDEVYERTCDLQDPYAIFGADLYYHSNCLRHYLDKYEKDLTREAQSSKSMKRRELFERFIKEVEPDMKSGTAYTLTHLKEKCSALITADLDISFSNRDIRMLLIDRFGEDVSFCKPKAANQSASVFLNNITKEEMVDRIRHIDVMKESACKIRQLLLKEDFGLQDKFCDAEELHDAWDSIEIPKDIKTFF